MKKRLAVLILIIFAIAVILCGCIPQPFVEQVINVNDDTNVTHNPNDVDDNNETADRVLYVSGAVQTDGYVTVPLICDYKTLLETVGVTAYTVTPDDLSKFIASNADSYIANFICDGVEYASVNVNGVYVTAGVSIEGVDSAVVDKLARYIEKYGAITNRNKLKLALGDDYESNYYKFYIDKLDYAQDN